MEHQQQKQSQAREEATEFNLKEWGLKAKIISRENTISRRYSASNIRSFREDNNTRSSFRSNFTISSTASSPGYPYLRGQYTIQHNISLIIYLYLFISIILTIFIDLYLRILQKKSTLLPIRSLLLLKVVITS